MSNPTDSSGGMPSASELQALTKKRLHMFFQQKYVKSRVNALVPGTMAAILSSVFGSAVTGEATAPAAQNGLASLGISFSDDSIEKLLKPLEGGGRRTFSKKGLASKQISPTN